MNQTRRVRISFEAFLKRSWPVLVIAAVVVIAVSSILYYVAISGKVRREQTNGNPPPVQTTSTEPIVETVPRALDGVLVPANAATLQPYAVMVENSPEARPLSGVSRASVVMEAPVEGGITRFMLVFDASSTAAEIGPVRSARPYFVDWAQGLKAVYAHVGGSGEALAKIQALSGFRNVDEFSSGKYFWRSRARSMPHNTYTSDGLLGNAVEDKGWDVGVFQSWRYLAPSATTTSEAPDVSDIQIPYGGTFNVRWAYDRGANVYTRYQAGFIQKDADKAVVTSTNVVILQTEEQVLDAEGRLKIRTTGSGKAWLFRDGKRFDLRWRRSEGGWLSFEGIDGTEALFRPGKTWISVVTSASLAPASLQAAPTP